ncbi:diguanylate cyclase (GGDEF) domain-containing protein [Duganella sp. CF517]|uniref:GGDEF domain-containing protein n=1 Tax=Duganella sp. CF517 TaxID=1881038 RepID=UPI0008B00DA0|nr:GGDEF domain-containing protein [Duganella sp. CF517]SEO09945.1 diguanylate cyclase (GGDEF) domain-containing protein [Duganella sp. CF517]
MLQLHRSTLIAAGLALLGCLFLYASLGVAKSFDHWKWTDIVSEGGTAVMAGSWVLFTLSSRPGGLVTRLLAGGLALIMIGSFADCMDEFFAISKAARWDHWLEGMVPVGMLVVTIGMYYWRHEQFRLNEHLQKRERLFRDHRAFDRITQLANADYLRRQIRHEQARRPGQPCALVLLDIDGFHLINREFGQPEGDRVLQAVGHMLLLNLRNDDLLCRYAGDRFALLLPDTSVEEAASLARHLTAMVGHMRHHAKGGRVGVSLRHACSNADAAPEVLLAELSRAVSQAAAASTTVMAAAGGAPAGPAPLAATAAA